MSYWIVGKVHKDISEIVADTSRSTRQRKNKAAGIVVSSIETTRKDKKLKFELHNEQIFID